MPLNDIEIFLQLLLTQMEPSVITIYAILIKSLREILHAEAMKVIYLVVTTIKVKPTVMNLN